MKPFDKVAIIGVGLIGGSIGLAAKRKGLAREVIGVCRHKESLQKARKKGALDKGTLDYKEAVRDADLVILAAPVRQIIKLAGEIAPYIKEGALVTDAGSTKSDIVSNLDKISRGKGFYFVGAHPLAGSEQRGVAKARADLFEGARCILTKTKATNPSALRRASAFWQEIGSRTTVLSPQEHDKVVALISHLPHLAAVELVKTARSVLNFSSSGFLDTTRIASSDAEIWTDIFFTNKKFVTQAIDNYIKQLKLTKDLIRKEDKSRLSTEFKKVKSLRDGLRK
ncbi:MAG: prephenate dehydrogenase [Candidatus Omnitrophota bacterium]|nr:MAG: prephenate dehydrogenase [Candidatus Omnitrophota bacterium]